MTIDKNEVAQILRKQRVSAFEVLEDIGAEEFELADSIMIELNVAAPLNNSEYEKLAVVLAEINVELNG